MYSIQINLAHDKQIDIVCDSKDVKETLSMLENSKSVKEYKLCFAGVQMYREALVYTGFGGYMYPAGKCVDKFTFGN